MPAGSREAGLSFGMALLVSACLRRVTVVGTEKGLGRAIAGTSRGRRATRPPIRWLCRRPATRQVGDLAGRRGARRWGLFGDLLDEGVVLVGGDAGEQELS